MLVKRQIGDSCERRHEAQHDRFMQIRKRRRVLTKALFIWSAAASVYSHSIDRPGTPKHPLDTMPDARAVVVVQQVDGETLAAMIVSIRYFAAIGRSKGSHSAAAAVLDMLQACLD